jgi:plastocyanin
MALISAVVLMLLVSACNKSNEGFLPQGGQLPTRYVSIRDSAIVPNTLIIAVGNSITFLNQTNEIRSIVSDDNTTILTGAIEPGRSFFYKKDTTGTFLIKCVENPALTGTIIITP